MTLLVEQQGKLLFASDRPTLVALRDTCFFQPELLDGSEIALPAVGIAAAYLLILAKAGRVVTKVMTQEAKAALSEEGIDFKAGSTVKKLPAAVGDPMQAYDQRAHEAITAQAFVEDLKRISY